MKSLLLAAMLLSGQAASAEPLFDGRALRIDPNEPPDAQLQERWEELLSKGGCEIPTPGSMAKLERRYGARKSLIHERLIARYGKDRANADWIRVGACRKGWDRMYAEDRFRDDLEYWEACLDIKPSRRVKTCPQ